MEVKKEGIVLEKSGRPFEQEGVLNPAVLQEGLNIHLFYRAVGEGNFSTIGYCRLNGPLQVVERREIPLLIPAEAYESQGIEDPRMVKIDGTYYLTYTGYDGVNALGCLALSADLRHFERKGVVVPQIRHDDFRRLAQAKGDALEHYFKTHRQEEMYRKKTEGITPLVWDKNLVFYPRRIGGQFAFLHRIRPGIQLVMVDKLSDLTEEFWEDYFRDFQANILMDPVYKHEASYMGGGCPPIETSAGWLLIYHSAYDTEEGYRYVACAALFDLENPRKEIARLPFPLFSPELRYELSGTVNNVCFPTGTALVDGRLYVYYGAADERIACASVTLKDLVQELLRFSKAG